MTKCGFLDIVHITVNVLVVLNVFKKFSKKRSQLVGKNVPAVQVAAIY